MRTLIPRERRKHPRLEESEPLCLHAADQIFRVRLLLVGPFWRYIQSKIWDSRIDLPGQTFALVTFVHPKEDGLRVYLSRVILLDHVRLGLIQ